VLPRCLVVAVALLAGCGSFSATESPSADASADAAAAGDATSLADADASGDAGDLGDAGAAALLSAQDCELKGSVLVDEHFSTLPPSGWNLDNPSSLVALDGDPGDFVSAPTGFRAGIVARTSGTTFGTLQRTFNQAVMGTICVTFQGRLFMGTETFGKAAADQVGLFGIELRATAAGPPTPQVMLVVRRGGLLLRVVDAAGDAVTSSPINHGDGAYERWGIVLSRAARKAALWVGSDTTALPLDLPFDPGNITFGFGVATTGQVSTVTFHMDDLRIAVVP